jgi:threonyl-tRNA synthetase
MNETDNKELNKNDHRQIGKDLNLFTFSDTVGKGLPLYTERGASIRRELEHFVIEEELKRGYKHVITPDIAKLDLYKKSGHYPYYKENMYAPIVIDDEEFMLRPMTCPHHFELYLAKPHSYKELPIRIAELAKLYRYEDSGNLSGLVRVRSFCLADSHIICTDNNQAKEEVKKVLDLIEFMVQKFGLKKGEDYWYRLSLGDRNDDKKYYKDDKSWDDAESILREVLQGQDTKFVEAENEAAFYGPKIDIQMKSVRGKEDTAFTIQYDFVMPKRFNLTYIDKDNTEKEAVVIHRSSIGAIERIMAFLIEKYEGSFPTWLSPVQVKILPISDKHFEYSGKVFNDLLQAGIRVEIDKNNETLGKKIRDAKMEKVPYLIVIGDKEVETSSLTIEGRNSKEELKIEDFLGKMQVEIKERK